LFDYPILYQNISLDFPINATSIRTIVTNMHATHKYLHWLIPSGEQVYLSKLFAIDFYALRAIV